MKKMMLVSTVIVLGLAFGQQLRPMTEDMVKSTGGRIVKPGSQIGEIVYVNCQSAAKKEWLDESVKYFIAETRFKISMKDGSFDLRNPAVVGNATLFIVDDASLPALLAAPENAWAVVNVAKLKTEKAQFFEARVKKELSRGFAYLCGGCDSSYNGALTGSVKKAADLDTHTNYQLPVDVLARFQKYMPAFGVTSAKISTYKMACKQGWAPQPTNEYQKAIWDRVHEPPSKPIKISYDKDRQKPVVK